jgi:hypothetical protein
VLTEAINLYRTSGYMEVAAFNDEPYAHHWFEMRLAPSSIEHDPDRKRWCAVPLCRHESSTCY